ncbi:MAG: FAD:protein FMN transferase [Clostridia bacterium]|nr:FAD:protein FMN transferase [Clostridia bacterium]
MKRLLCLCVALCLLTVCFGFCGCGKEPEPKTRLYYEYFDTVCTVYSYRDETDGEFEENAELCRSLLREYHELLDIYNEYEGKVNLATLNRTAAGGAVAVSDELFAFLTFTAGVAGATGETVSPTVGALTSLWHEQRVIADEGGTASLPDENALAEAKTHISLSSLVLDAEAKTVYFSDPALKLDAGAFGKGYVLKRTAQALTEKGVTSYLLNYGGNVLAVGGKPSGEAFHVGIRSPFEGRSYPAVLSMKDTAVASSGSYERKLTVGGKTYSHVIDPATGYPPERFASVSVVCADAAVGDALSTALYCMTEEEGQKLLSGIKSAEVLWIGTDGRVSYTSGLPDLADLK